MEDTKQLIRVTYTLNHIIIMKTFQVSNSKIDGLSDENIIQMIYNIICNQKKSHNVYLNMMILCDSSDNIIRHLC
jgi:hypothetical protein